MRIPRPLTSRRTTIALALSAPLSLAACRLDPPSASRPDAPDATPLPDAELVTSAREGIVRRMTSVAAVSAAHPRLGRELAPWSALHAAHLAVLDDGTADASEDAGDAEILPTEGVDLARRRLLAEEAALAGILADAARQAASGDLARVLASMSAAVTQRLTT